MKTLSICQPWASLIAIGAKRFETRSWATKYRGPLAIHASKSFRTQEKNLILSQPFKNALKNLCFRESVLECDYGKNIFAFMPENLPLGKIIATCNLVDCLEIRTNGPRKGSKTENIMLILPDEPELSFGDYDPGRYALLLTDVKMLPEPIPAKGQLGLWNWDGNP